METDISIWQKPGHFYFALTPQVAPTSLLWIDRADLLVQEK
jgi:hypothetical protein